MYKRLDFLSDQGNTECYPNKKVARKEKTNVEARSCQFRDAMAMWKSFPEDHKYSKPVVSVVIDSCGAERQLRVAEQVWEEVRAR